MSNGRSGRIGSGLVTAGSAAVLAVFTAGYLQTEGAAEHFVRQVAHRRVAGAAPRPRSFPIRPWTSAEENHPEAGAVQEQRTDAAPQTAWKDGYYKGWGYSRHGNIEALVIIKSGRIASAIISQCRTRYSCSVIDPLPPEVAERQSPNVDYVSGATQSADAFYQAVVTALNKAR